ncbi:hypothetical protein D3C85_1619640 [compost metagenome]
MGDFPRENFKCTGNISCLEARQHAVTQQPGHVGVGDHQGAPAQYFAMAAQFIECRVALNIARGCRKYPHGKLLKMNVSWLLYFSLAFLGLRHRFWCYTFYT